MAYHTPIYLFLFLPVTILCYALCPQKHRWKVLLIFSYLFFFCVSRKLVVYIMGATVLTYGIGLWLDRLQYRCKEKAKERNREEKKKLKTLYVKKQRAVLMTGILVLVGCLAFLKYYNFYALSANSYMNTKGIGGFRFRTLNLAVPLGISFYTLQAIGYMIDVYRGTVPAEKHPGKIALFLSFFPQLMEGPFYRYGEMAKQLCAGRQITGKNLAFGCQRIIWGMFKKLLIADRLNALVKTVFDNYTGYSGAIIFAGAVFYTIQLYMEFSGAIDIVIGSAEIFGIKMPENFRQPFFARNASEFWRRWHISLGAWFRDYIFYPVSMSGAMKKWNKWGRKHVGEYLTKIVLTVVALFPVWLCNGLWHGSNWTFLFYGMYYFVIISLENILEPVTAWGLGRLKVTKENKIYHGLQVGKTLVIVFIGEMFFRAVSIEAGKNMFLGIFQNFGISQLWDGTLLTLGMDGSDFAVVFAGIAIVLIADVMKERGVCIRETIAAQKAPVRWTIYYAALFSVIILGAYGVGYLPVDLIYAGF